MRALNGIDGIQVFQNNRQQDERGWFSELYNSNTEIGQLFPNGVQQVSRSSSHSNVIRGLHLQFNMPKLVHVSFGAAMLYVVDMRPDAKTFAQWMRFHLSHANIRVFVPDYCAIGFESIFSAHMEYLHGAVHSPSLAHTIAYNDSKIGIPWTVTNPILSEKDQHGMSSEAWIEVYRAHQELRFMTEIGGRTTV
jgi:dTDP-4-dehydrorhamnose 3,5-epimerase